MSYVEFVRRAMSVVLIVGIVILLGLLFGRLLSILLTVFTCWVLSIGVNALIYRLQRRGLNRGVAALVVITGIFLFLTLIVLIVLPPFIEQAANLVEAIPAAIDSLVRSYENFWNNNENFQNVLPQFTYEDYRTLLESPSLEFLVSEDGEAAIDINSIASSALPILGGIGSFVGSLLANLTIIFLITGYLVADPLVYYRPIVALVPAGRESRTVEILNRIRRDVISWMGALSISVSITSVAVTLVMGVILQIPNAVALGVIAGLGTFIPNIGYYIGLIPIIIVTAAQDPAKVIPAALLYWLINELEGKLIAPNLIRHTLNIPAGVVLPFQLIAASLFGFLGILLAVPILAIVVALVQETYVFDTLKKRGRLPKLEIDNYGRLVLTKQKAAEELPPPDIEAPQPSGTD